MQQIKTVLLIDDDTISSWLNKTMLERTQLIETIETIDAGQSAIDYLQQSCSDPLAGRTNCPDLILLDLDMPVVNGFDVLEALQKSENCAWLISDRIIVLTTTINPKDLEKAKSYHIYDFLVKPLTESKIVNVLQEFISRNNREDREDTLPDQKKSNSNRLL
jgi:CheY-like chemotaxis protein